MAVARPLHQNERVPGKKGESSEGRVMENGGWRMEGRRVASCVPGIPDSEQIAEPGLNYYGEALSVKLPTDTQGELRWPWQRQ